MIGLKKQGKFTMLSKEYNDNEEMFLNAIADDWGFVDFKCKQVFTYRFLSDNDDLGNSALVVRVLKDILSSREDENEQIEDAQRSLKYHLNKIFSKMEVQGCDFQDVGKDKFLIAKSWLRGTVYLQWFKQQLWDELKTKTTAKNKMGVVLAGNVGHLGMRHKTPNLYLDTVPINSDIWLKINLEQPGHLILLEREPSGVMCCICPSEYAPQFQVKPGETTLPQYPPSPYPVFTATEEGQEQMLAVITPDKPSLHWLEKSQQEALELDHQHLYELLTYVEGRSDSQVFYTEYQVVDVLKTV
jgi:hypothetical protein